MIYFKMFRAWYAFFDNYFTLYLSQQKADPRSHSHHWVCLFSLLIFCRLRWGLCDQLGPVVFGNTVWHPPCYQRYFASWKRYFSTRIYYPSVVLNSSWNRKAWRLRRAQTFSFYYFWAVQQLLIVFWLPLCFSALNHDHNSTDLSN